jgi:hypothetical protein
LLLLQADDHLAALGSRVLDAVVHYRGRGVREFSGWLPDGLKAKPHWN